MSQLRALVATELRQSVRSEIYTVALELERRLGGESVLFYGSALRADDLDGVLDFYVLQNGPRADLIWPRISYHEIEVSGRTIRAKVASMPLETFERAASGKLIDTTIWARFAQPSKLLLARTSDVAERVVDAVVLSIRTAARYAAVLGPASGTAEEFWLALFDRTFSLEFRVEKAGRGNSILAANPAYFEWVLVLAWRELGLIPMGQHAPYSPMIDKAERRRWRGRWRRRRLAGKALGIIRLLKAAWTFDGAARYALWKIERHRGLRIELTPWRERHPVLAAPGVLFHLWRTSNR